MSEYEYEQLYFDRMKNLYAAANLAPLAASDAVLPLITLALNTLQKEGDAQPPTDRRTFESINSAVVGLRKSLHAAGRRDLWDTPENEAEA